MNFLKESMEEFIQDFSEKPYASGEDFLKKSLGEVPEGFLKEFLKIWETMLCYFRN